MKNTIKTIVMLLGIATIMACCISCKNKTKNEAENQANQEVSLKEQEDGEQSAYDDYLEELKQAMRKEGRYYGYYYATCLEAHRGEAFWLDREWSGWKASLISKTDLTNSDINILERVYKENFHDGWVMGQSDKK